MTFCSEADERSKQMAVQRLVERTAMLAEKNGISLECLDPSPEETESQLNFPEYRSLGVNTGTLVQDILDGRTWGRRASSIIIEGGNTLSRERFANVCLAMGLMANIKEDGEILARIHMSQIIPVFNSFEETRFEMINRLSGVRILLIEEIDPPQITTTRNDMKYMVDSVLLNRKSKGIPTIITLSRRSGEYKTQDLGRMLQQMIQSTHSSEDGILKIILSGE